MLMKLGAFLAMQSLTYENWAVTTGAWLPTISGKLSGYYKSTHIDQSGHQIEQSIDLENVSKRLRERTQIKNRCTLGAKNGGQSYQASLCE